MEEGAIHGRTIRLGRDQFHCMTYHLMIEHRRRHPTQYRRDRGDMGMKVAGFRKMAGQLGRRRAILNANLWESKKCKATIDPG